MGPSEPENEETRDLLQRVRGGDRAALSRLLTQHRDALIRLVSLRMDQQMRGRLDPSDVVQEAQLEAAQRIDYFLEHQPMPFGLWLHTLARQQLFRLRRKHVEADCRSVAWQVSLPEDSSAMLARQLLEDTSTPSAPLREQELAERLQRALGQLSEDDRDLLLMRNFEGLTNQEVAQLLEVPLNTASQRYGRALLRLRKVLLESGLQDSDS
jgi:RNA polymerase sigma-70 factor (ECF subfamily)